MNKFLTDRIKSTQKRGTVTLIVGSLLIAAFYLVIIAGFSYYREFKNNPHLIADFSMEKIQSQLRSIETSFEKDKTNPLTKSTKNIKSNFEKIPQRLIKNLETDLKAKNELVLTEFLASLPGTLKSISDEQKEELKAALSGTSQEDLDTIVNEKIAPSIKRLFYKPDYGDFDTFQAVCTKMRKLQSGNDLTAEELLELQMLSVGAMLFNADKP